MESTTVNEREKDYEQLLQGTGLTLMECVCLGKSLSEQRAELELPPELSLVRDANLYGNALRQWVEMQQSRSFREVARLHVEDKRNKRSRTRRECSEMLARMMREVPGLAGQMVRSMTTEYCRQVIGRVFETQAMRNKARRILHNFFETCRINGWCGKNPVADIHYAAAEESTIHVLSLPQIGKLLQTVYRPEHRDCAAAVGLMLWCGIRPYEVARLQWGDVDLAERVVFVSPRHSKTGGARQVPLRAPVLRLLRRESAARAAGGRIVPRNWTRRWKRLRRAAGFAVWRADTLRHTFASYHFKFFQDAGQLQWEMGHTSAAQLRSRYLNMRGFTRAEAARFWKACPELEPAG